MMNANNIQSTFWPFQSSASTSRCIPSGRWTISVGAQHDSVRLLTNKVIHSLTITSVVGDKGKRIVIHVRKKATGVGVLSN